MDLAEKLLREILMERCGAYSRTTGQPCRSKPMANPLTGKKLRCRMHGGASTGPQTLEGKARIAEARRRSGHMTSPYRWILKIGLSTVRTKEDARRLIRKKNNKQAYVRKKYQDYTIKL